MSESQADRDFIARALRWAITGVLIAVVFLVLVRILRAALTPLAVAFVLAYLLDPLIDRFQSSGMRRSAAILGLLSVFGIGLGALLFFVIPRLIQEVTSLAAAFPTYLESFSQSFVPRIEERFGITVPTTLTEALERVRSGEIPLPFEPLAGILQGALSYLTSTAGVLVGLLVIPILSFYALAEFDHIVERVGNCVPPRHRVYVNEKARLTDRLVSSFLRGQVLIAIVLGGLYAVGFSIIGIDLAVTVGLIAGALSIIPYVGSAFALVAGVILALLKFGPDAHVLWVIGWYAVVQTAEGFVITPRIQSQSIGLHPAVVIVALLIGADLFGFLGLLIAVPLAAVIKVFLDELLALYRASSLYGAEEEPAAAEP